MQLPKALVAEPSEELRDSLNCALADRFRVLTCAAGTEALDILERWMPDVLILELELPGMDGIGLLRRLRSMPHRPRVLVLTRMNTPFVLGALQELEVDYAMRKPTPTAIVAERAAELLYTSAGDDLTRAAADAMLALSIPDASQGFRNLLVGLPSLAACHDQSLSKELYPRIARENRVSVGSVEKSIRDAIHTGWSRGERTRWNRFFPGFTRCPTNREFLFRLAGCLSRLRRCG